MDKIIGSVGRSKDFDGDFLPIRRSLGERWKRVDRAFHMGVELPAVELYQLGGRDLLRARRQPPRQRSPLPGHAVDRSRGDSALRRFTRRVVRSERYSSKSEGTRGGLAVHRGLNRPPRKGKTTLIESRNEMVGTRPASLRSRYEATARRTYTDRRPRTDQARSCDRSTNRLGPHPRVGGTGSLPRTALRFRGDGPITPPMVVGAEGQRDERKRDRTLWTSCAAGAWIPSRASWLRIREVDRTPGLGFRALLTEDGIERLDLTKA